MGVMIMIFNYYRKAKKNSYKTDANGKPVKRKDSDVIALVIHNTGNNKDTAKNNVDYFATGNARSAGAHVFIDKQGLSARSIPRQYIAWSVGDKNGRGTYWGTYTNTNTLSIELCDIVSSDINDKQLKKLKQVIRYYARKFPNCNDIVRHYDITTKSCPERYCNNNKNNAKWQLLKNELMNEIRKIRNGGV